jgi:hypothetical protein
MMKKKKGNRGNQEVPVKVFVLITAIVNLITSIVMLLKHLLE